jgi:hypothetical protein
MAFLGGNTITTAAGNDMIPTNGSRNIVNPGIGRNEIEDSGNTLALPQGGHGSDDIDGYVLQNQDLFDLRPSLAATTWNGSRATIGDFVNRTTVSGADTAVSVVSGGKIWGLSDNVPTLHDSGPSTLSTLLAHAST